jgi:mannose-6-phosphate isomerase-like protein (cupin superfamily)
MPFYRWSDILKDVQPGSTLPAGMSRRGIIIGDLMVCAHEAFPDLKCKPHTHPSAQLAIMLKGKMGMRIGEEERVIVPGEFAYVPANVEHSIESFDEYVLEIDIFHPIRQDIEKRLKELGQEG